MYLSDGRQLGLPVYARKNQSRLNPTDFGGGSASPRPVVMPMGTPDMRPDSMPAGWAGRLAGCRGLFLQLLLETFAESVSHPIGFHRHSFWFSAMRRRNKRPFGFGNTDFPDFGVSRSQVITGRYSDAQTAGHLLAVCLCSFVVQIPMPTRGRCDRDIPCFSLSGIVCFGQCGSGIMERFQKHFPVEAPLHLDFQENVFCSSGRFE